MAAWKIIKPFYRKRIKNFTQSRKVIKLQGKGCNNPERINCSVIKTPTLSGEWKFIS